MAEKIPKILLVLGDAKFAAAMASYLGSRGFETVVSGNPQEALRTIDTVAPDAAVVSQLMPAMDGVALVAKLKQYRAKLPIALISAVTSNAGLNDVRRTCQADAVLPATFQPEALVMTLRRLGSPPEPRRHAPTPTATQAVEETLKNAPQVSAPPAPVPPAPEAIARSSVASTAMEPAWLLSRAFADNVTGALRFVSGGIERTIYFSQGRPIVVTSNVPEERIGQLLLRKGKISAPELQSALLVAMRKQKRFAEIVVDMGIMTLREQDDEVAAQYALRVMALFAWREASIEFTSRPPPIELVPIRLAPERLIVDGLRVHYDVQRLESLFPDPLQAFTLTADAAQRLAYLGLTDLEASALVLADGARSIAEIATLAASRADALRAIYACVCLGVLS